MARYTEVESGWERRVVADPARAREAMEVYARAGFEVRVEPATPDQVRDECEPCILMQARLFRAIYTRRPVAPGGPA